MAAAPDHKAWVDEAQREGVALRSSRVMGLAAETFNGGLRACCMTFVATAWFLSPWALTTVMAVTVGVVWILYRREFHFDLLSVLADDVPAG